MSLKPATLLLFVALSVCAQTNPPAEKISHATNSPAAVLQHIEAVRADCIQGRRSICGKILKILPEGLVVESGYPDLMRAQLENSWLVPGTVVTHRDPQLIEASAPDSVCVGLVFLTNLPKLRGVKPAAYDYVIIQGYPAGEQTYTSVGTVQRTVRRFSASLEGAIRLKLQAEEKLSGAK